MTPCYETDIEDKEEWEEIVSHGDGYGCTDEAPVELLRMSDDHFMLSQTEDVIGSEKES